MAFLAVIGTRFMDCRKVLRLKNDNEGTVLMIEVGYKYKFFGDDATVCHLISNVVGHSLRCMYVGRCQRAWHGLVQ